MSTPPVWWVSSATWITVGTSVTCSTSLSVRTPPRSSVRTSVGHRSGRRVWAGTCTMSISWKAWIGCSNSKSAVPTVWRVVRTTIHTKQSQRMNTSPKTVTTLPWGLSPKQWATVTWLGSEPGNRTTGWIWPCGKTESISLPIITSKPLKTYWQLLL